jgi:ABC-2 type transport system permease protein
VLRNVFTKTLWDQRRSLLAWVIGVAAATAMYAAFYPSIRNPEMAAALENYPQAVIQAFGLQDMVSPEGYLQSTVFGIIGPILIILFAVGTGARAIAGDEEAGTLDLLLAYPITRTQVLLQRFAALVTALLIIGVAVLAVLFAIAGSAELDIPVVRMAAMILHLVLLGVCFGSLALAMGATLGRRGLALAVTGVAAILTYFANTLAPQVDSLAWLRRLSPFYYYSGGQPLRNGLQVGDAGILLVVVAILVAMGVFAFNRRDVAV